MLKRLKVFGLIMMMGLSSATVVNAQQDVKANKEVYADSFRIEDEADLGAKSEEYDMPSEVREFVEDTFAKNENAKVTVYSPDDSASATGGIAAFADTGKWGKQRTYKGYTLKDWKVHMENNFGHTNLNATGKLKKAIFVYFASELADKIMPFGSAGLALADYCFGNGNIQYAGSGDKASCDPSFTADTKFTYVKSGGSWLLGARTHKAKLLDIDWYYYCKKTGKRSYKRHVYNKVLRSPNFKNPDAVAITGTGIGGVLDGSIKIKVKNVTFALE